MATLVGSVASASADADTTVTASHTRPAGSNLEIYAIVAQTWVDAGDSCDSVTYNGTNMTQISDSPAGNNSPVFRALSVWRLLEASMPAEGTYNCTANFGESVATVSIFVFAINALNQGTLEDTAPFASSSATGSSFSMTSTSAGAIALTATMHDNLGSFTHGTDQTEIFDSQVNLTTPLTVTASIETLGAAGAATQTDNYGSSDKCVGLCWIVGAASAAVTAQVIWLS